MIGLGWTDERTEIAVNLWKEGVSATEIAKTLSGTTRNAVIGKMHRLGLMSGRDAVRQKASKPSKMAAVKKPIIQKPVLKIAGRGTVFEQPEPRQSRVKIPNREEKSGLRTIMTVGFGECRWPIGDVRDDDFSLCGLSAEGSYCEKHRKIAHDETVGKKRSANELMRGLRRYV